MKTKIIYLISILWIGIGNVFAQTSGTNYILTKTYMQDNGTTSLDEVQYFDDLGRLREVVQKNITPSLKDLVSLQEYDLNGRESKTWLPAVISANNGKYVTPATVSSAAISTYGNDQNPYNMPVYEVSPLGRPVEQYGPGKEWHDNRKAVKTGYLFNNTASDSLNCIKYISGAVPNAISITRSGNYGANQLFVTRMEDENGNRMYEFKDCNDQVVLSRQIHGTELIDTYYVYDVFGNLKVVIPPEAVSRMSGSGSWTDTDTNMKLYCYLYKYDHRNRCTGKKLPGCDWITYVYDKGDRMIFSQDGEQAAKSPKEWSFTIPDGLGREVLSGTCTDTISVSNKLVKAEFSQTGTYNGYTIKVNGAVQSFRSTPVVLSVNYYDNYQYRSLSGFSAANLGYKSTGIDAAYLKRYGTDASVVEHKGLLTGTATAQLGGSTGMLYSCLYYDNKGQLIQSRSTNHLAGGVEEEYVAYNFTGQPVKSEHVHSATGKTTQTEYYTYQYDHAGRLLKTTHQLKEGTNAPKAAVILAEHTYDELGRLSKTKKNNQAKLTQDYKYNVRSWLTEVTNDNAANRLFEQKLYYNDPYGGSTRQYNGNISAMSWKADGEATLHGYTFGYDNLSRLTAANYLVNGSANTNYKTAYTYDKQGNIKTLQRYGKTSASAYGMIDNLTFNYDGTGNQLKSISDAAGNIAYDLSADFKNYSSATTKYTYNKNGAMTQDLAKGISNIQYNSLHLPKLVDIKSPQGEARNEYTYSAGGVKLQTVQKWNPNYSNSPVIGSAVNTALLTQSKTTDYVGNKIYENGSLKRILVDGGYIEGGTYYFYLTDHLGNNRIVANQSGTVVQKNHYYPFGTAFAEATDQGKQPYKYNGKELDSERGLNLYDYSARYYESATGRFTTVDPLAEKYYSISPYAYCANNPVNMIDPDGMESIFPDEDEEPEDLFKKFKSAFSIKNHVGKYFGLDNITPKKDIANKDEFLESRKESHQRAQQTVETFEQITELLETVVPYSSVIRLGAGLEANDMDAVWAVAPFALLDVSGGGTGKLLKKLPLKGLTVKDQAKTISHFIKKNTVIVDTPNIRYFYDLRGAPHKGVSTPHIQRAFRNVSPDGTVFWNKDSKWVESMTQQDIRTVRNILKRR